MKKIAIVLCLLFTCLTISHAQDPNPADFDGSGRVDFPDFLIFAGGFGKSTTDTGFDNRLDFSGNGTIDFPDFLVFAQNFGKSPSDPQEVFLYIADFSGNQVGVINTTTNLLETSRSISVSEPRGVAVTESRVYIAAHDTFHAFTKNSASPIFAIPLESVFTPNQGLQRRGGFRVVLSNDEKFAFVTEESAGLLEIFDVQSGSSVKQIILDSSPGDIIKSPDGSRAYIAHGAGVQNISVIDIPNQSLLETLPIGTQISRLAISQDGKTLYFNKDTDSENSVQAFNLETKTIQGSVQIGLASDFTVRIYDIATSPDGNHIYAAIWRAFPNSTGDIAQWGGLIVIDTQTFTQIREIKLGDLATSMGIAPDGKTAYVAGLETDGESGENLPIFIVDLENNRPLGSIRNFKAPVEFTFNANKPAAPKLPQLFFSF